MPTNAQSRLKRDHIVAYVQEIAADKEAGWNHLMEDIRNSNGPKATYEWRIDVWAMCLAQRLMTSHEIPPRFARRVAEKYLKEASDRIRNDAADVGTAVHAVIDRLTNGEIFDIPSSLKDHIGSWKQFVAQYKMHFIESEFTVYNPEYYYAGTGDFIGYSDVHPEWEITAGDYKSSVSGIWPDVALQLSAIANAAFIGRPDGTEDRKTLKRIKTLIAVQITAQGYRVVEVKAAKAAFGVFLAAADVARWKRDYEMFALDDSRDFVPLHERYRIYEL